MEPTEEEMRQVRGSPEWRMVIDNLEQMHPRYLVALLKDPEELEEAVKQKLRAYVETVVRLRKSMPVREAREIAQDGFLTPVNPNWQDEKPLSPEEEAKLEAYLDGLASESDGDADE